MSYAPIEQAISPKDLLVRAHELEQLANLVNYGADKVRLRERASRLRRQAEQAPAGSGR